MSPDPNADLAGGLDALAGDGLAACAAASPQVCEVPAPGTPALPLAGSRFDFGSAASMVLSILRIRDDERESLRRAIESDAKLARLLTRRPQSPTAMLRRAARRAVRAR